MPGGMEFDCIDAFAARVERMVFGCMPVGEAGEREDVGMRESETVAGKRVEMPGGAFALDGADQRRVGRERVVTLEWLRLVGDFLRLAVGGCIHRLSPSAVLVFFVAVIF